MTDTTLLTIDMAILIGIFLIGFLAKIFPKAGHKERAAENSKERLSDHG